MQLQKPWTPGYFDVTIEDPAADALSALADTMIPGDTSHPSASDARVVSFIAGHADPQEAKTLVAFAHAWQAQGGNDQALRDLERSNADDFALARFYIYSGYYCSPVVIDNLQALGYDYHASPQPLGYQVEADVPVLTVQRGTFIPTEEVRNALHS